MKLLKSPYAIAGKLSMIAGLLLLIILIARDKAFFSNPLIILGFVFVVVGMIMLLAVAMFQNKLRRLMDNGICYHGEVLEIQGTFIGFKISGYRCFYALCAYQQLD